MSPRKKTHHQDRHIQVRSVRKYPPDLKKIAGALIALAQAQAEAEAQAKAAQPDTDDQPANGPEGDAA